MFTDLLFRFIIGSDCFVGACFSKTIHLGSRVSDSVQNTIITETLCQITTRVDSCTRRRKVCTLSAVFVFHVTLPEPIMTLSVQTWGEEKPG
jgi:hypothetical protein